MKKTPGCFYALGAIGLLLSACAQSPPTLATPPGAAAAHYLTLQNGAGTGPAPPAGGVATVVAAGGAIAPLPGVTPGGKASLEAVVYANGGANLANPFAFSLILEQDLATGAMRGYVITARTQPDQTAFGFITQGQIVHADGAGGKATLHGVLTDGRPFSLVVTSTTGPTSPDQFDMQIPGEAPYAGQVFSGAVRIVHALPAGPAFIATPGFVYDDPIGLPIAAADAALEHHGPQRLYPPNAYRLVAPDPIELPNGSLPGTWNNLPGIGWNVPQMVAGHAVFPDGRPVFASNHPSLLDGLGGAPAVAPPTAGARPGPLARAAAGHPVP